MNPNEMMNLLGLRMEDAEADDFTPAFKLTALGNGLIDVVQLLHPAYLTGLKVIDANVSVTTGYVALSTLVYEALRGEEGIIKVKVTGGKFCTKSDVEDIKRTENVFLQGTLDNPIFYLFENKIFVLPTTIAAIDVFYLRMPKPILYEFNYQAYGTPSTTQFVADAGQSLSAVDGTYSANGGVAIYSLQYKSYHVVTAYVGSTRTFTVTPAATGNFTNNNKFYFLTHSFDRLKLEGITLDINPSLHELIVTLAEAEGWAMCDQLPRREAALKSAYLKIEALNAQRKKAAGVGTEGRERS